MGYVEECCEIKQKCIKLKCEHRLLFSSLCVKEMGREGQRRSPESLTFYSFSVS